MLPASLIPHAAPAAICLTGDQHRRAARRIACGRLPAGIRLTRQAQEIVASRSAAGELVPGRVLCTGSFEDPTLFRRLARRLPAACAAALRPQFEGYACRGAHFHTDAHYGDVLFGAWCVSGPAREIVFPRLGLRLPGAVGCWVLFDPFEPHAVLDRGAPRYRRDDYEQAEPNGLVGFEVRLTPGVRAAFGIDAAPGDAAQRDSGSLPALSSARRVDPETGALLA